MQDITRGQTRVRAWPTPRGKAKTQAQQDAQDQFRVVQKMAAYFAPGMLAYIHQATANSPLLIRDVVTMQLYNRWMAFQLEDGRQLYPMPAVNDVSEALDVLSNLIGDYLVRTSEGWRGASTLPSPPTRIKQAVARLSADLPVGNNRGDRLAFDVITDDPGGWWKGPPHNCWQPDAPGFYNLEICICKNGVTLTGVGISDEPTLEYITLGLSGPARQREHLSTTLYTDGTKRWTSTTFSSATGTRIIKDPWNSYFKITGPF